MKYSLQYIILFRDSYTPQVCEISMNIFITSHYDRSSIWIMIATIELLKLICMNALVLFFYEFLMYFLMFTN